MRLALLFALLALAAPLSAADQSVSVGSVDAGNGVTADETKVWTAHLASSQTEPCPNSWQSDGAHATGGVMNEHVGVHAEQQRGAYDCYGTTATSEYTTVYAERRTGDSTGGATVAAYDWDANNGSQCGTYVYAFGPSAQPGCVPFSQRAPYVLDRLP